MCAGMDFCGQCENPAVRSWSDGKTHRLPRFGDAAQRSSATNRRIKKLTELFASGKDEIRFWPEWSKVTTEAGLKPSDSIARIKSRMYPIIDPPGRGASRQRKHKYQLRIRNWTWEVELANRLKKAVGLCQYFDSAAITRAA